MSLLNLTSIAVFLNVHFEIIFVIFHCVGDIDFLRELKECSDEVPLQLCENTQANEGFCGVK